MSSDPEASLNLAKWMCYVVGLLAILFGTYDLLGYSAAHTNYVGAHAKYLEEYAKAQDYISQHPGAKIKPDTAIDAPMSLMAYGGAFFVTGVALIVSGLLLGKGLPIGAMGGIGLCGVNVLLALAAIAQGAMKKDYAQAVGAGLVLVAAAAAILMLIKSLSALKEDTVPGSTRGAPTPARKPVAKPGVKPVAKTGSKPMGTKPGSNLPPSRR